MCKDNLYRVGIIGCGFIARKHLWAYANIDRTTVVAVADKRAEQLSSCSAEYSIKGLYTDYMEMLDKERLDIVSICTYPSSHCEITVEAAKYKPKGILCEKPIAPSLVEADIMIEACNSSGVKLVIGHQRRFGPQHKLARQMLECGDLGQIYLMIASFPSDMFWWGTHVVDMVRFYGGDVRNVMAQIYKQENWLEPPLGYQHSGEDMAIGYIELKTGLRCILLETEKEAAVIRVIGESGQMEVNMDGGLRFKTETSPHWTVREFEDFGYFQTEFKLEIEELLNCIEQDREHLCNGKEGRVALEVIIAVFESSRCRSLVQLPLEAQGSPVDIMLEAFRS